MINLIAQQTNSTSMVQTLRLHLTTLRKSHTGLGKKSPIPLGQGDISAFYEQEPRADEEAPSAFTVMEQTNQEEIKPAAKELPSSTAGTSKRPAPKFPSPSECSKWLMLYWFAGFSIPKIRWLLSQFFKLDVHKAYDVENLEATFRRLQRNANRNNPDYYIEPYMYYIMTSKSSSPFEFRQSATRWLDQHYPGKAAEMTEDDEIKEMAAWHVRWSEEVQLMQKSKVPKYLDRAETFARKLDYYAAHFDTKSHVAYFEDEASIRPTRHSKMAGALPNRSRSASRNTESRREWGHDIPIHNIDRPKLTVRTKVEQLFQRSKAEGTPTPSVAQHLDDLGFFARRPRRPAPGSIIEPKTRTPSLSSAEGSNASKTSLTLHTQP